MNTELIKRLKEAAEKYQEEYETTERVAFTHGVVWGYKEAIKVAKEWLKEYTLTNHTANGNICTVFFETKKELIANFETDMNKFLEGEK